MRQAFRRLIEGPAGSARAVETTLVGRDGREHVVIWHSTVLGAEGGQVLAAVSSGEDITERKRAEEALQRTERLYRTLAEEFPNGSVFLFDRELRFTLAEGEGLRTVGPPREEIIGRRVDEVFGLEQAHILLPAYRGALAGQASSFEAVFADRVYQVHVVPVHGSGEGVELGMVMTQDITERKQAEVERERLIAELRDALASVRTLRGLLPICASCKKIRDDQGYWLQVDDYLRAHVDVSISHGLCHDCAVKLYPEMFEGSAVEGERH
jgi:PAS domain S-box-containing protein